MSRSLPPVTGSEMVRALQKAGFVITRISGSHHRPVHSSDASRAVTVPVHGSKALKEAAFSSVMSWPRFLSYGALAPA